MAYPNCQEKFRNYLNLISIYHFIIANLYLIFCTKQSTMEREFNITGSCNPQIHYMADISSKVDEIYQMVKKGKYFTINRPHQYGKTTIQSILAKRVNENPDSLALLMSFEAIDYEIYQSKTRFIDAFLLRLSEGFEMIAYDEIAEYTSGHVKLIDSFDMLSTFISKLVKKANKKIILIIDEVDRSSNNQLFLDFLAMLRSRFLKRNQDIHYPTFHSVILSGIHDVKTLKYRIDPKATLKYNSPWNIAVDFTIDLSLNPGEIKSMIDDYCLEKNSQFDTDKIAERLHYYTSGHPFLVSYLCKIIDEELIVNRNNKNWQTGDVDEAFKMILERRNTNFESLIKNLENNPELYNVIFDIIVRAKVISFNLDNPIVELGITYGFFARNNQRLQIHNVIYEQRIYNYMISKLETLDNLPGLENKYVKNDILDVKHLLLGFQTFMQENHSGKNKEFLEKQGTLLFLAFTKPVINGKGFDFKEVQVSEERRLDVVLTFLDQKYIIELKIWRGEEAHQNGLNQLSDYLDRQNLKTGYLLIYDFRINEKEYKHQQIKHKDKDIFAVWV